jgi:hypothetical protein
VGLFVRRRRPQIAFTHKLPNMLGAPHRARSMKQAL